MARPKKKVEEIVAPEIKADLPMKIACCGTASYSLNSVPFDDPTWKIWSLCFNYNKFKRADKWFEIHDEGLLKDVGLDPKAIEELKKMKGDLLSFAKQGMFPDATPFPFQLCIDYFPRKYFTSSIAWMMALAIMTIEQIGLKTGVKCELGLYGVHMTDTDEYHYQKGGIEYLIGQAEGRGIKVTIDHGSPICRTPRMYAFEDVGISRELAVRRRDLSQLIQRHELAYQAERDAFWLMKGRLQEVNEISNNWR
jgi:hypothetical protein